MTHIGILSDTHSCWDDRYALHFNDCDEIWHAATSAARTLFSASRPLRPW